MTERPRIALRTLTRHAAKFSVVGLAGAALDYGLLLAVMHFGVGAALARIPAVAITLVFTWYLNRTLTFRTKSPPNWHEFSHYALAALTGVAINLIIYWGSLIVPAPVWIAFTCGTGTAAIYTFLIYRKILYDN